MCASLSTVGSFERTDLITLKLHRNFNYLTENKNHEKKFPTIFVIWHKFSKKKQKLRILRQKWAIFLAKTALKQLIIDLSFSYFHAHPEIKIAVWELNICEILIKNHIINYYFNTQAVGWDHGDHQRQTLVINFNFFNLRLIMNMSDLCK